MPLDPQNVPVNLFGLEQKTDPRQLEPGKLTIANNVDMRESGKLARRRGYRRVNVDRNSMDRAVRTAGDLLFHRLAVYNGSLLILAHSKLYATAFPLNAFNVTSGTSGIIERGRLGRSGVRAHVVATAERGDGQGSL